MTDEWGKVERLPAPLRTQIVAKLRRAISEGVFRPGDRMVERSLTEFLDVSRPSVREAIRQLEAEGLVEVIPNRGPVVRQLSLEEAGDVYDMRIATESLCARYFAERGTEEEMDRLEEALAIFERELETKDRKRILQAKNAYYEAFAAGSHSEIVQTTIRQLIARISFLWTSALRRPDRLAEGLNELREVVDAIRRRDGAAASEAVARNVTHARPIGLGTLQRLEAERKEGTGKAVRKAGGNRTVW